MQTMPPRPGQSRIVLLSEKPKALGLDAASCGAKVDGSETGALKPGTALWDRPAGRHEIVAPQTLSPGDTRRDIATESGRTYFLLAQTSRRANVVTGRAIMDGLAGALVASAATSGSESSGRSIFSIG